MQRYKDYGITEVEILADKDERQCEVCGKLHKKRYPTSANVPIPAHPRCRCTVIPVVEDEKPMLDIIVDKFVPCLEDAETGEILQTVSQKIDSESLKEYNKKSGWAFNWEKLKKDGYEIQSVKLKGDNTIQGLVALQDDNANQGVKVVCASSAPWNQGEHRRFYGVGGHLFAIAVDKSLSNGYGGYIYAFAKNTELLEYYCSETMCSGKHIPSIQPYCVAWEERNAIELYRRYNYEKQ